MSKICKNLEANGKKRYLFRFFLQTFFSFQFCRSTRNSSIVGWKKIATRKKSEKKIVGFGSTACSH